MDMRLAGISRSTIKVLNYLLNGGGAVTAPLPKIAKDLEICRTTALKAVRELEKRGVLAIERGFEPNGRTLPCTYRVVG